MTPDWCIPVVTMVQPSLQILVDWNNGSNLTIPPSLTGLNHATQTGPDTGTFLAVNPGVIDSVQS